MRIPHTVPVNTLRAYNASVQTVSLVGERLRQLQAENFTWDEAIPPSLANICVQVLAANFKEHYEVLSFLPQQDFDYLLEILSVNLPINVVAPIIDENVYWVRCCQSRWANQPLDISRHGNSWKRMYIERHIEDYIHYQEPGYVDWDDVRDVMTVCSPFVQRISINELKPPREYGPEPVPPDTCLRGTVDPDHIDLKPVLSILINLQELSIRFGVRQCGMKYKPDFFRVSLADVTNLGEGLKSLPQLKIFRLHRSAIDDIRANIVITALLECNSLETLEISYCKIGDIGAKSLGKLLISHRNIKSLIIPDNNIRSEGAIGLAYALQHGDCCPITVLDLEFNLIGDEGGVCLSTAIVKNTTLNELHLGGTGMTSIAATKIASGLLFSENLKTVNLFNNHFGEDASDIMVHAARSNRNLIVLDIRNCDLGVEAETKINEYISRNRQIKRRKNELLQ